jgi:hypothetical protein
MGRVTYEGMAGFWPTSSLPAAAPMNDIPKVVFSRTLQSADWPETRIARGDTAEGIARVKAEPGGEILAQGGTQRVPVARRHDRKAKLPVAEFLRLGRPLGLAKAPSADSLNRSAAANVGAVGVRAANQGGRIHCFVRR